MCAFAAAVSYDEFDIRSSGVIKCCTVYARLCWNVVVCFVVILLFSALMFASFPFFFFVILKFSQIIVGERIGTFVSCQGFFFPSLLSFYKSFYVQSFRRTSFILMLHTCKTVY